MSISRATAAFTNGTTADASQVESEFNNLCNNAAKQGANSDITSLSGLTTSLSVAQGGTGSTTAAAARTALGTAASGANTDITSLGGLTTALSIAQGGTAGTTAAAARTALAVPGLADTNTFTANQTLSSADAGTTADPNLVLDRNSASPVANDYLGQIKFRGRDTIGSATDYCNIYTQIIDPSNLSEDGRLVISALIAGTETAIMTLGPGTQFGTPTGGDKGVGTVNATIYDQGQRVVSATSKYDSGSQTITAAGSLTLAHSLTAKPNIIMLYLKNLTTELNYSVNDEVLISQNGAIGSSTTNGISVVPDATNINIRFGSGTNLFALTDKTSGTATNITNAYWALIVRAWV